MFPFFMKRRYRYNKKLLKLWNNYIFKEFGAVKELLRERSSTKQPIHIAVIEPTPEKNYYTLVTLGMGTYKMARCPRNMPNRLELAIRLPADWEVENIREAWHWPIRWLRLLARVPQQGKTRFEHGHTMDICRCLTADSKIRGFAFHSPAEELPMMELSKGDKFGVLCVIPIYEEELTYATDCDTEKLFQRMDEATLYGPVDMERKNTCL